MDIHKEKPQDSNTIKHPSLWEGLVRLKSDSKYGQFLRFCINGVLAVAIQYAVYWVLIKWINVNIAYTLSYLVSFCCNFVITSYWTFHSSPSWKRLIGFGSSHIVNFFVQLGFLNLYLWLGIPKEWAALLAMGSAVPVNFAMLHFVYKKPEKVKSIN